MPDPLSLLQLSPDAQLQIAQLLNPRDRLALALTSRRLLLAVWPSHVRHDLTSRFAIETRLTFSLLPSVAPSRRLVPSRSQQSHLLLAVSDDGHLAAALPYDNRLRLFRVDDQALLASLVVTAHAPELWDVSRSHRAPHPRPSHLAYAHLAALDVHPSLSFASHSPALLLAAPCALSLLQVPSLKPLATANLLPVRQHLDLPPDAPIVASAAAISPCARLVAWVVFASQPAHVYISVWSVDQPSMSLRAVHRVAAIRARNWSTLGWARPVFSPNGRYVAVVANVAEHAVRLRRVADEFHRNNLCRYAFYLFDVQQLYQDADAPMIPLRNTDEWLEVSPDRHPAQLAEALARLFEGFDIYPVQPVHAARSNARGFALNALHTCPAEATYKALSFGDNCAHPWFVTKQPQYSLHLCASGDRVLAASLPQSNRVVAFLGDHVRMVPREHSVGRLHAFKKMPWRSAFAAGTAFSNNGKWLAGACLLDDDECCMSVRNLTVDEYFG